jgi:hypothetical protein
MNAVIGGVGGVGRRRRRRAASAASAGVGGVGRRRRLRTARPSASLYKSAARARQKHIVLRVPAAFDDSFRLLCPVLAHCDALAIATRTLRFVPYDSYRHCDTFAPPGINLTYPRLEIVISDRGQNHIVGYVGLGLTAVRMVYCLLSLTLYVCL